MFRVHVKYVSRVDQYYILHRYLTLLDCIIHNIAYWVSQNPLQYMCDLYLY